MTYFSKAYYPIQMHDVAWVLDLGDKQKKEAFKIWLARHDRLFDLQMGQLLYSYRWNQLTDLIIGLYERLNAIRYPKTVQGYEFYHSCKQQLDIDARWLEYAPPGSLEMRKGGKRIKRLLNNADWRYIGK